MAVVVPTVFIINGFTKDWGSAFVFAVVTAVGLTPEMLPLVVTANLAKGAQMMSRARVIVKRLAAIQDLGGWMCSPQTRRERSPRTGSCLSVTSTPTASRAIARSGGRP